MMDSKYIVLILPLCVIVLFLCSYLFLKIYLRRIKILNEKNKAKLLEFKIKINSTVMLSELVKQNHILNLTLAIYLVFLLTPLTLAIIHNFQHQYLFYLIMALVSSAIFLPVTWILRKAAYENENNFSFQKYLDLQNYSDSNFKKQKFLKKYDNKKFLHFAKKLKIIIHKIEKTKNNRKKKHLTYLIAYLIEKFIDKNINEHLQKNALADFLFYFF